MTGAQIVQAPPWPGASFTEEQPEPGADIRIALALERGSLGRCARVHQARSRGRDVVARGQRGPGRGRTGPARGSSLGEAAFEYAAQRSAHLGEFRWTCQECGET